MTDEFENALRRALRPGEPGEPGNDFAARICSRIKADASGRGPTSEARGGSLRQRLLRTSWLPAALAACIVAGIGLVHVREQALHAARARQAREQLLQALSIASDNINIVRGVVAREENPDS